MPAVLEQDFFQQAYEQYCEVVETLSAEESTEWEHGEVERYINQSGRELLRRLFQGHLDRRYSEEVYHHHVVGADGEVRPHRRKRTQSIQATAQHHTVEVTIVLDFIHVLDYVWKAAFCFCPVGSPAAEAWVQKHALRLLNGQAREVAADIRRSATQRELSPKARENADKCADYLLKYHPYLRYDHYLAQGYPIASGIIEGACRHLVRDRMDITGARWRLDCAEAVLRLRALRASHDFDAYWQFHKRQEFNRNHLARFQEPERFLNG